MVVVNQPAAIVAGLCMAVKLIWACYRLNRYCNQNTSDGVVVKREVVITSPPKRSNPYESAYEEQEEQRAIVCPKLEDFSQSVQINRLSNKELISLLTSNHVSVDGCLDREDLLIMAMTLWERHYSLEAIVNDVLEDAPAEKLCKICMHGPLDCVLLDCGHIASCMACGLKLKECPICRRTIIRVVRTFKV